MVNARTLVSTIISEQGISFEKHHNIKLITASIALMTSLSASAGLGGLNVQSHLGEPFTGSITVTAGEQVSFHVTYTNSSKTPCAVGGEGANAGVDLKITSGAAQVYTRSLCAATAVQKAEVAAGAEAATDLAWDRKINVLGCSSASTAQKGSYWATATVNGVSSAPVNFVIQ